MLLLGVDAFLGLPTWRRWTELFDFAHLAVANRPGYASAAPRCRRPWPTEVRRRQAAPTPWASARRPPVQFDMTPLASPPPTSAPLRAGQSLRYLLPPPLLTIFTRHQLYL